MHSIGRLFQRDVLPTICRAKGCYGDVQTGGQFCLAHFRTHLLGLNPPKQRQFEAPRAKNEWGLPTNLYVIRTPEHMKFGVSIDVKKRMKELQTGAPMPLKIWGSMPGIPLLESVIHRRLREYRSSGEWFRCEQPVMALAALIRSKDLVGLLVLLRDSALTERIYRYLPKKSEPKLAGLE